MLGVILGTGLSTIGSLFTQFLTNRRDEKKWERERAAQKEDKAFASEVADREDLVELYHQCVNTLSTFITCAQNKAGEAEPDVTQPLADVHQWLSLLAIRHPTKEFLEKIDDFLESPLKIFADRLRKHVLDLAKADAQRFGEYVYADEIEDDNQPTQTSIQFIIESDFRKLQMLDGLDLPRVYRTQYDFMALSREHRQRILDLFFDAKKTLPNTIQLHIPAHSPNSPGLGRKVWEAKIDPNKSNLNDVLDVWAKEYDDHLETATLSLQNRQN